MSISPRICLLGLVTIFSLSCETHASLFNGFQVEPHSIPLEDILSGGPPRDGIPALMEPKVLRGKENKFLGPQDRVLGLHGIHQTKAYPIAILNRHEIVNDTIDGIPAVITYCPLCGTGMGF